MPELLPSLVRKMLQGSAERNQAERRGRDGNVDRLVSAATELLTRFGYGSFASMAADAIRQNVSEKDAAATLARLHELTRPPYA